MKLLIADDDATSRMLLKAMLTKWDFECVMAEDGQAGWEIMQEKVPPSFLFIDWEMPNMNGIELIKRIRLKQTNNPPYIILLTARNETADIVEGLNSGANDYVIKPFNKAELRARIDVGVRVLNLQGDLYQAQSRLSKERIVIENIISKMQSAHEFDSQDIRCLNLPVEVTSGDIYFSSRCINNKQYLMLGDFTGHGLVAALGGPVASDIFYAMAEKGVPTLDIAKEINHQMFNKMPTGLFLTAIFFEVNSERTQVQVWNCGMENVLLFRDQKLAEKISSTSLPLGIVDKFEAEPEMLTVKSGDRFYAYSDGITETVNTNGELFGQDRLIQAISNMLSADTNIKVIADAVLEYRGNTEQLDDLTVLELTC